MSAPDKIFSVSPNVANHIQIKLTVCFSFIIVSFFLRKLYHSLPKAFYIEIIPITIFDNKKMKALVRRYNFRKIY